MCCAYAIDPSPQRQPKEDMRTSKSLSIASIARPQFGGARVIAQERYRTTQMRGAVVAPCSSRAPEGYARAPIGSGRVSSGLKDQKPVAPRTLARGPDDAHTRRRITGPTRTQDCGDNREARRSGAENNPGPHPLYVKGLRHGGRLALATMPEREVATQAGRHSSRTGRRVRGTPPVQPLR